MSDAISRSVGGESAARMRPWVGPVGRNAVTGIRQWAPAGSAEPGRPGVTART